MQYWPRKRAKRAYARVRSYSQLDAGLMGFAGYKVGMTHALIRDNRPHSETKDQEIFCPITVIECPPLRIISVRFYKKTPYGLKITKEIMAKGDAILARRLRLPKNENRTEGIKPEDFDDIRVIVQTQPHLTSIGKKKPEVFETQLGGDLQQKFEFAKNNFGKEIRAVNVLKEGQQIDTHAITKGKGFQGPVKRFGVKMLPQKSRKTKRGPANVGSWTGNRSRTVAHAGQMGYHQRMEHNKWLIKISDKPETINAKGGLMHYGNVRSDYILVKGSVAGPHKRLIRMIPSIRPSSKLPLEAPSISYIRVKKD